MRFYCNEKRPKTIKFDYFSTRDYLHEPLGVEVLIPTLVLPHIGHASDEQRNGGVIRFHHDAVAQPELDVPDDDTTANI